MNPFLTWSLIFSLIMAAIVPPEIQVYASFPKVLALGHDLNLHHSNWHCVHCLTIPTDTLKELKLSQKPFKWIRYAIGVVIGAEGDLSFGSDPLNVVNYDAGFPALTTILYYHINDNEKLKMFPIDPDIQRTTITSSLASTQRDRFRDEVATRDGNRCIVTGVTHDCQTAHLLARSKGDEVYHSCPQSVLADRLHSGSTLRLILGVAAKISLAATSYLRSTVFGTVFSISCTSRCNG